MKKSTPLTAALLFTALLPLPQAGAQEAKPAADCCASDGQKSKLADIQKLIHELEQGIAQKERECREMRAQADALAKQGAELKTKLDAATAEAAEQRGLAGKAAATVKDLEARMTAMVPKEQADALAVKVKQGEETASKLTMERDVLTTKLQQAADEAGKQVQMVASLTSKVDLQTKAAEAAQVLAKGLEQKFTAEATKLRETNSALDAEVKAAAQRQAAAEANMKKLTDDLAAQRRMAEETAAGLMAKLDEQSKMSASQAVTLQRLEKQNADALARQRGFETQLASARDSLNSAQTELDNARARMVDNPENRIAPVYYEAGAEENNAELQRVLADAQRIIGKFPEAAFTIVGYASEDGSFEANMRLSAHRAEKVGLFLKSNGVRAERITLSSAGATRSMAAKSTAELKLDRRVEIRVAPVVR